MEWIEAHWHLVTGYTTLVLMVGRTWQISGDTRKQVTQMNGTLGEVKTSTDKCQARQELCPHANPDVVHPGA